MQLWITINRFMKLHNPVAGDQMITNYCSINATDLLIYKIELMGALNP